jgi:hypothetical protein
LGKARKFTPSDLLAEKEAVVEGIELLALGQLVGGSNHANQWHLGTRRAVVKEALVEDCKERVEDR